MRMAASVVYVALTHALVAVLLTSGPVVVQMNLDSNVSGVLLRVGTRVEAETVACLQTAVLTVGELNTYLHLIHRPKAKALQRPSSGHSYEGS